MEKLKIDQLFPLFCGVVGEVTIKWIYSDVFQRHILRLGKKTLKQSLFFGLNSKNDKGVYT